MKGKFFSAGFQHTGAYLVSFIFQLFKEHVVYGTLFLGLIRSFGNKLKMEEWSWVEEAREKSTKLKYHPVSVPDSLCGQWQNTILIFVWSPFYSFIPSPACYRSFRLSLKIWMYCHNKFIRGYLKQQRFEWHKWTSL